LFIFFYGIVARKRTRRTSHIVLDRLKVAGILITIGGLFFFTFFMAHQSPIFTALSYPTYQLFGEKWSVIFFALLTTIGGVMLLKADRYNRWLFKFGFLIMLLICGILNFPVLEVGFAGGVNPPMLKLIGANGGRLGYLALRGMNVLLGGEGKAVKIIFIAASILLAVLIGIYYKLKLPSLPAVQFAGMKERIANAVSTPKSTRTVVSKGGKKVVYDEDETIEEEEDEETTQDTVTTTSPALLKSLLKEKISKAVVKKEDEHTLRQIHITFPKDKPTFALTLLDEAPVMDQPVDEEWLYEKAENIKNKLLEFDIEVDVEWVNVWPTVMQIKIKPQAGIKISKIENLQKDLALALKTKSLRILAPIPGTDSVGIEIPNPKPQLVSLREVLGWVTFAKAMQSGFTNLTVGKGIDGLHVVKSLEEMPHLLIAGATGSGKSVSVNDYIIALMYQNSPSELKFIMVDPKQVELSIYEGIPYLLSPIITQADKAVKVLKWAVDFMEERYKKLKETKVRNLAEYNQKVDEKDAFYRLVIIIDELADLMMSGNKKDTENYITRIAQKARAVGIHLILATQRPSVNVITGLIKANIPTRIAHGVVSQIDSRTILDMKGAEDLVGKGDLLYTDPKNNFPVRVQAPYISTIETEHVVKAIKDKYMKNLSEEAIYHPEIIRILEAKTDSMEWTELSGDDEELMQQAIEIIAQTRKASATLLQRKLGIGFPRAARLIDQLEERGLVWPQEGAKPREILM
jgi:S-DNA-T family DNA segregation ATPase FtsK/SpoIIIE